MASASGTPYSMEGGHGSSSIHVDDGDHEASGAFFTTDTTRLDELKTQLDGSKDNQKLEAMKRIIGMIAKGRHVASLFPAVVKNVVSKNLEIKKLVYVYLVRYAEEEQDLALLSISTFQKALKDPNQLIRASALRVLSSIRVPVIVPIMMLSLKECVTDMSAFVRKTAAHAIPKLYSLDPEQKDNLIEIIERLLKDKTTLVAGSAVVAFEEVCPERIDLVHKNYRKLCNLLVDVEDWGQVAIINMLTRYARSQFANPNAEGQEMGEEKFYSSENDENSDSDSKDEDQAAGKETEKKKKKPYVMDSDHRLLLQSTKPLLQSRNTAVVMSVAQLYFHTAPSGEISQVIRPLIRLLRSHREVQTVVLSNIATISASRKGMFESFLKSFYVVSSDPTHIKMLKLEILSNLASETNVSVILREFQTYVTSNDKEFVAATIQAIGRCASNIDEVSDACLVGLMSLVSHRDEAVVAESVVVIKTLLQMRPSEQKESIIQMAKLADRVQVPMAKASILWLIGEYSDRMPKIAPDVLRKMAKSFPNEEDIVKLQVLNLSAKLCLTNPKQTKLLCQYVLNMAKYDLNYDIRDRARFLRTLLVPAEKTPLSKYSKKMFLAAKPAPVLQSTFKEREQWQMGSLSHMLNTQVNGFKPLPDFPDEPPDPSVRNVEVEMPWQSPSKARSKKRSKKTGLDAFYDSESSEVSDSGSSGSESRSEESGSEESSGAETDSEATSGEGTEESDSEELSVSVDETETSDEDSSEEESEASEQERERKRVKKPPATRPSKGGTDKKSSSTATPQQQLLDLEDFNEGSSLTAQPAAAGSLLQPTSSTDLDSLLLTDLQPLQVVSSSYSSKESIELLHRIAGKGLSASYRFTRKGHLYSEQMVDLQVSLTNNGSAAIEDIAVANKKLSSQMEIHEFPPIASLGAGETLSVSLGVNFNDTTNPAKFDISTKTDKFPVQIDARVGELVRGVMMTESSFLALQGKLTGMNESASKVTVVESVCDPSVLTSRVIQAANVASVGSPSVDKGKTVIQFAGQTYSEGVAVLVTIQLTNETRDCRVVANCEKMVIGSMLVKEIKSLLAKP